MKYARRVRNFIFLGFILFTLIYSSTREHWQGVEAALEDGLPRTAIAYLDKILEQTQKEGQYNEWMRAMTEKIVIEATIEGNKPEEKVTRLKAEFANADMTTRPLLQAILAQWYWQYYNRNRWRFMSRTATEGMSEEDFTTWDLPKIFKKIDSLYQDIVKAKSVLVKIPVESFIGFLEEGSMPEYLRPTLYDFIAHEALLFYTSAEQAVAMPEDAFEFDANSDVFAPFDVFLKYKPVIEDTSSPKFKALLLYQELARFHLEQKNMNGLLDLEIQRFYYIKNNSFGDNRNTTYIKRLTDIVEKYGKYEMSSLAAYYLGRAWAEEGDCVKAYEIAEKGSRAHPKSMGGEYCAIYMRELMTKSLNLLGEQCIPPGPSEIRVSYKNFTKLYFRIYSDDWDEFMKVEYGYPNQIEEERIVEILGRRPVHEWSIDIPETKDLKEHTIDVDLPELESGYYRVFASWEPDFKNSSMVQHTWLWVSSFTLVSRTGPGRIDGLVVDATTGEPIADARVTQILRKEYRWFKYGAKAVTDSNGYFCFREDEVEVLLHVKKGREELVSSDWQYAYRNYGPEPDERTVFFTDRSLYRPGQTIYFKGICAHIDQGRDNYAVIPNRKVTVYFRDANYQEVSRLDLVTNDFGSISGQFIAPADRLTGSMSIETDYPDGAVSFRVEEYKRPKFSVEIEKPKQAVRLNDQIDITGKAIAYTGAPIDNASVRFTVLRTASFPYWWYWWYSGRHYSSTSQEIAHGKIKTDADGNFKITFFAKPDLEISPDEDPTFTYAINADVIASDGETRSGSTSIRLGYAALSISLSTSDALLDSRTFPFVVTTQTLDGTNLPAQAQLKIFKLKEPAQPVRAELYGYDYWGYETVLEEKTAEFGPDWQTWPKDKMVFETGLSTEKSNPETLDIKLPVGLYRAECTAKDQYGKEVRTFLSLMVLPDWKAKTFRIMLPSVAKADKYNVEVGNDLHVLWGTGYETGRCFIEIERDGKMVRSYWTEKGTTQHSLTIPVSENDRGGFTVHLTQIRENRAYLNQLPVYVPWDNKELFVTLETFRDKLQPGEKERITLKIAGKKNAIAAAEMVATMYDFSLDQFYSHDWYALNFFKYHYSEVYSTFVNTTQWYDTWQNTWNDSWYYPSITYIHFPGYLIEDFFYYRFPAVSKVIYSGEKEFEGGFGRVKGKVTDANTGDPIEGADIEIESTKLSATSDDNGEFQIKDVPEGEYSVTASCAGYESATLYNVKSEKGRYTTIKFRLAPSGTGEAYYPNAAVQKAMPVASPSVCETATGGSRVAKGEAERTVADAATIVALEKADGDRRDGGVAVPAAIDLKAVTIRRNLNETAFFYPHLLMEKDGTIKIEFTMPEALTKWKFMGLAHGKKCESGMVTGYTVTQKDLMIQPNAPRFMREGDTLYFTAKVVNASDQRLKGKAQLDFTDFITESPMNDALSLKDHVQNFDIEAHSSQAFAWRLQVPKGINPLAYTVVAKSEKLSDGEAGAIPVLSSRIFLTESMPLWIRGAQSKKFTFERLREIGKTETLEPFKFTVQMASNPMWYAIQALPYLIEFPYECSEQVFNRLYANSLAGYIADSDPRIRTVFDQWRGTEALQSNLEKNQDLKSVMLMETPWVIEAQDETQAKKNVGILFEKNTLGANLKSAFSKLKNMQYSDGSWPWFPGGWPDPYITLYITTGFGRLHHLGVATDMSLAQNSLDYLDRWITDIYDHLLNRSANNLSPLIAFYLYGRSFYLEEQSIPSYAKVAVDYFLGQGEQYWLTLNSRLSQGYLSLALNRFNRVETAKKILASIKERSVENEEMGMFWREDELSWWWYRAPIETQALMIEAFSEVVNDTMAVEDCKVWLLKQKQTQNWHTTKATADAVYALILRGTKYLAETKLVQVKLGDMEVKPASVEAGTGYYKVAYRKDEIKPSFADISLVKENKGIAWGGVHFQYFEEMSKVTAHTTNLQLEKKLFVKRDTKKGKVIEPLSGPLHVGDLITVRIVLRVDRDMEYVHLKDMRGSGLEPVDVLSVYKYQDGLRYYQSTKDVASHFFIDYLPKGTYVFEYDLRVQLKGKYQTGVAEIQCMYAPEFTSHSESIWLDVE